MKLEKAVFSWEGTGTYSGFSGGILWNGWECPLFTFETAASILLNSAEVHSFEYCKRSKRFSVVTEWTEYELPDTAQGQWFDVDGQSVLLFPILDGWCWNKEGGR